jgi:hypothetical protein
VGADAQFRAVELRICAHRGALRSDFPLSGLTVGQWADDVGKQRPALPKITTR